MATPVPRRRLPVRWILAVVLVAGAFGARRSVCRVPEDYAGVLWKRFDGGTVLDRTLPPGIHVIAPWNRVTDYPLTAQNLVNSTTTLDAAGRPVDVVYLVRYELDADAVPRLHQAVGPDYRQKLVAPTAVAAIARTVAHSPLADDDPSLPVTEWSREAAATVSTVLHENGLGLIYFAIESAHRREVASTPDSSAQTDPAEEENLPDSADAPER